MDSPLWNRAEIKCCRGSASRSAEESAPHRSGVESWHSVRAANGEGIGFAVRQDGEHTLVHQRLEAGRRLALVA